MSAAMFNSLWEGVLIAGAVWLGLRLVPQLGAATRYVVWLFALIALAVIPMVTALVPRAHPAGPVRYSVITEETTVVPAQRADAAPATQLAVPQSALPPLPRSSQQISVPPALPIGAVLLWAIVSATRAIALAFNLFGLVKMRRGAVLWSSAYDYPVYLSREVEVPLALGFLRPVVLLPAILVEEQSRDAVEAIVVHEIAHLQRGDVWTNALARILEAFVALNPVAWFVLRQLSIEREIACDDWVVARLGAGDVFARALAMMASCAGARAPLAAPSAIGSKHSVVARIEQLLDARPRQLRLSLSALGAALMVLALIAMVVQSVSPVLAYAPEQKTVEVASACTTPNHGVLEDFSYYTGDTTTHDWTPVPTLDDYTQAIKKDPRQRNLTVGVADVTFDASGHVTKVVVVTLPNIPDAHAHLAHHFTHEVYRPAVVNCKAVATTIRAVAVMQFQESERTQSNVAPAYPEGWGAQHASACRVPNLVHDGVPALRGVANLPALTASVRVDVDARGAVTNATIARSSGRADFDAALLATARGATYPLDESSGFKPVRPSGAMLNWNATHGYAVYSKCAPLPTEYIWTATHTPSQMRMVP